jgi:hypothetical protein
MTIDLTSLAAQTLHHLDYHTTLPEVEVQVNETMHVMFHQRYQEHDDVHHCCYYCHEISFPSFSKSEQEEDNDQYLLPMQYRES